MDGRYRLRVEVASDAGKTARVHMVARSVRFGAALIAGGWTGSAWACTLCHSRAAEQVRAAVFGPDFWSNLGALAAPAPVLVAAVMLVRRVSP